MGPASSAATPLPPSLAPALLTWYRTHHRKLPWRADRTPYRVWVAEVLLQQTRVDQAVPYFERFLHAFPTLESLARARAERVLKLWQGAGYYARAHRLHAAARHVVRERGGELPSTVPELEALPGVGPYIARAVAAIAFGRPVVALEANGLRVAARWTREEGDVRDPRVRVRLERALEAVLSRSEPGTFNEAVMELGETVCRPQRPACPSCPVADACRAYRELGDPGAVPMRGRRGQRPKIRAAVVVLSDRGRWFVQRRPASGLLPGLWEFPGGRIERGESPQRAARRELREETGLGVDHLVRLGVVRHAYSHFTVELHAFAGRPRGQSRAEDGTPRRWVTPSEFRRLPVPKATEKVVALALSPRGRTGAIRGARARPRGSPRPRQSRESRTGGPGSPGRRPGAPGSRAPGRSREG